MRKKVHDKYIKQSLTPYNNEFFNYSWPLQLRFVLVELAFEPWFTHVMHNWQVCTNSASCRIGWNI